MSGYKNKSALLELLNSNKAWDAPPFKRPVFDAKAQDRIDYAARCVADVDKSDPWAGSRARLYMLGGLELPSDVYKDFCSKRAILQRAALARGAFESLAPLKRRVDEDKAWNQFRAKQYEEDKAA